MSCAENGHEFVLTSSLCCLKCGTTITNAYKAERFEVKRLNDMLGTAGAEIARLASALETIRTNTRCPDPFEGGCIPSSGCPHEVASAALKKRREIPGVPGLEPGTIV